MKQLGDKIMSGFGLQCFAKTQCLLFLILLPEATFVIFTLQKAVNKGHDESIPAVGCPITPQEGGRPAERSWWYIPDQSTMPVPASPDLHRTGPASLDPCRAGPAASSHCP